MTAVASAEAPEYRYCEGCAREYIAELVSASSYEANGVGDTVQCSWCMGHNPAYIREEAESAVTVVDHPGEMGPHQDAFCAGCGTLLTFDEMDDEGRCWSCVNDDAPGYTSRGDAHLMAVTAPGAR